MLSVKLYTRFIKSDLFSGLKTTFVHVVLPFNSFIFLMIFRFRKTTLFLFTILLSTTLSAQKVGVVLSGGGALGIAHIGVLKQLEKNNIPIDYIAGTSMGAMIAGLYSCGYSPEEMEELVLNPEFQSLVTGKLNDKYIFYFKKQEPNASFLNLKLNLDSAFRTSLPTNVVSSYNLDYALMELTAPANAASGYNFDSLFVPFRCIGGDIKNKKQVVFKNGILSQAIRASATYPLYIKPIKVNNVLMFDGGLYNNFPADVIDKEFNPELIIGSNVAGTGGGEPDEDDLISYIKYMVMGRTNYNPICENMIIITPNVDVTVFDFTRNAQSIAEGERAAKEKLDSIKMYVRDYADPEGLQKKRETFRSKWKPLVFDDITFSGLTKKQTLYVKKLLSDKRRDTISSGMLKKQYFRLVADEKIKDIYPMAEQNDSCGHYNLHLNVKPDQSFEVQLGGSLSWKPVNTAFVGFRYKRLWDNAMSIYGNAYFGRVYNSAKFGLRFDFPSKTPFFIQPEYTFNRYNFFPNRGVVVEKTRLSSVITNQHEAGLAVGLPLTTRGKILAGGSFVYAQSDYYQSTNFIQSDTADRTIIRAGQAYVTYEQNSLDRKQFASRGGYLGVSLRYVNGFEFTYPGSTAISATTVENRPIWWLQFSVKAEKYFLRNRRFRPGFSAEFFYSSMPFLSNYNATLIMARQHAPNPESKVIYMEEFRSLFFMAAGPKVVCSITKNLEARAELSIFQNIREMDKQADLTASWGNYFHRMRTISTGGIVYHTPVGPVSLMFSYYQGARNPYSLMFNIGYIIHNKAAFD